MLTVPQRYIRTDRRTTYTVAIPRHAHGDNNSNSFQTVDAEKLEGTSAKISSRPIPTFVYQGGVSGSANLMAVVGSIPGRAAIKLPRSTQPSMPSG